MSTDKIADLQKEEERQDYLEHRDALLSMGVLLKMKEGQQLFKYLFKTLDVTCTPESYMEGNMLHQYIGHLKAGNSIYKLACEADYKIAASILSKLERERYEKLYAEYRNCSDD